MTTSTRLINSSAAVVNIDNLCLGCMNDKEAAVVCSACGWENGLEPDSALHLAPGTLLNGQYLIGQVLGFGGFGITYLAWDLNLNVKLAIKEYFPTAFATREPHTCRVSAYSGEAREHFEYGLDKFIEEARTLARFHDNPGVVSVLNFFQANSTGYIVMAYLDGVTLKEYLEAHGGALPFETALKVLTPVMDALREVHETGLLHRDISPDNIYITYTRQVKLLDFGAAKYAVGEHSQSLSVVLKPGYAPEEQYRSRGKQGPWTDVYALAATFYRAITGQVPPDALDRMESDDLQRPRQMGVLIPEAAEAALLKGLAVRAENRFPDIRAFQQAITVAVPPMDKKPCRSCGTSVNLAAKVCPRCGVYFETPARRTDLETSLTAFDFGYFGRRIGAYLCDSLLLSLFWLISFLICGFLLSVLRKDLGLRSSEITPIALLLASFAGSFVSLLYSILMEASPLQGTLGKLLFGIKVANADGSRVSLGKALARNLLKALSGMIAGVGFLIAVFDKKHQALHDSITACFVIKRESDKQEMLG